MSTPSAQYRIPDPQGKIILGVENSALKGTSSVETKGSAAVRGKPTEDFLSFKHRLGDDLKESARTRNVEDKSPGDDLYSILDQDWSNIAESNLNNLWKKEVKRNCSRLKVMQHKQKHVRESIGSRINWAPHEKMTYEDLVRATGAEVEE